MTIDIKNKEKIEIALSNKEVIDKIDSAITDNVLKFALSVVDSSKKYTIDSVNMPDLEENTESGHIYISSILFQSILVGVENRLSQMNKRMYDLSRATLIDSFFVKEKYISECIPLVSHIEKMFLSVNLDMLEFALSFTEYAKENPKIVNVAMMIICTHIISSEFMSSMSLKKETLEA